MVSTPWDPVVQAITSALEQMYTHRCVIKALGIMVLRILKINLHSEIVDVPSEWCF